MNFDMKNMTTYLGCIVLALFLVYLCTNMLSLNNKIVEGLASKPKKFTPADLLKQVEKTKTVLSDELNLSKYTPVYKNLLVSLEDVYHLAMLNTIVGQDMTKENAGAAADPKTATQLALYSKAIESLSSIDEFLTHNKSSGATAAVASTASSWL